MNLQKAITLLDQADALGLKYPDSLLSILCSNDATWHSSDCFEVHDATFYQHSIQDVVNARRAWCECMTGTLIWSDRPGSNMNELLFIVEKLVNYQEQAERIKKLKEGTLSYSEAKETLAFAFTLKEAQKHNGLGSYLGLLSEEEIEKITHLQGRSRNESVSQIRLLIKAQFKEDMLKGLRMEQPTQGSYSKLSQEEWENLYFVGSSWNQFDSQFESHFENEYANQSRTRGDLSLFNSYIQVEVENQLTILALKNSVIEGSGSVSFLPLSVAAKIRSNGWIPTECYETKRCYSPEKAQELLTLAKIHGKNGWIKAVKSAEETFSALN